MAFGRSLDNTLAPSYMAHIGLARIQTLRSCGEPIATTTVNLHGWAPEVRTENVAAFPGALFTSLPGSEARPALIQQTEPVAILLAALGADRQAFQIAARIATTREYPGPSIFWHPSMRGTLADPGFPALATQLGLLKYWTTTGTKPDVCNEESSPPFCKKI